jgi:hypothetical protein
MRSDPRREGVAGRPATAWLTRSGEDRREEQQPVDERRRQAADVSYEIQVGGRLGATICSAFPALRARSTGKDTVLSGVFADQAALYGVLTQLEALGLELIEVRRLPAP